MGSCIAPTPHGAIDSHFQQTSSIRAKQHHPSAFNCIFFGLAELKTKKHQIHHKLGVLFTTEPVCNSSGPLFVYGLWRDLDLPPLSSQCAPWLPFICKKNPLLLLGNIVYAWCCSYPHEKYHCLNIILVEEHFSQRKNMY